MSFRVRLHIHAPGDHSLGPGKVALLEAVDAEGSISAAARAIGMAYRHAWMLVDDMNRCFRGGVVATGAGGADGGGAVLTPFGRQLVARFRAMEQAANSAIAPDLAALAAELASAPARKKARARRAKR
ncbi:MAG: LysR family transcriptional regulator [Deltaproteobacteria bacterium]|nr:LysR family transcriptional regulator [Deltaproteobacteria bacterium]